MILRSLKILKLVVFAFTVACCLWSSASAPAMAANYGQKITIPADSGEALKGAAQDAAQTLQKMAGETFAVGTEYSGPGIWLVRSDATQAPADAAKWLAGKGREPFVIRSQDADRLWIVANRDEGLQHGLYFYLEQLGARFYFPNENWTIIPQRKDVALKIDRQMKPDYELRDFFGTGGFGPKMPVDPDQSIKARWEQWKRRNRFGGEFSLGGHSGEAFNTANKAVLEQHPEYLAKVNGQHVPWSLTAKLNTANPDAVKLYVNWTVERFRQVRKLNPDSRGSFAVSVDPSDGGGHCNSEECKQIGNGSASDQVFYIANQAAKAVAKEFPGAYVNLYGYNEHAMPPSIPLEPNVYVSIIPYAFQRTGMRPEEFIKAWGKKVKRMGIYDYWSIPDWSADLPSFDYLRTPRQKLPFWRASNIDAFSSESTYSAGAIGLAWYAASRMMWDLKTDEQAIINEFYDKSFGPAKVPMKRMLERWASGFKLAGYELAWSYRDMQEALQLAKTPEVRARLADYGRYLEYMRLRYLTEVTPGPERAAAKAALVRYVWDIYHTGMIHSYRIYQLLARGDKEMAETYNLKNKDAVGWKSVALPSDEEVFKAIAAGVQQLPLLDFTPRQFSGELKPLQAPATAPTTEKPAGIYVVGQTALTVYAAPGQSTLPLNFAGTDAVRVQFSDSAGKLLYEKQFEKAADWSLVKQGEGLEKLSIPIPAPGRYKLTLITLKNDTIYLQDTRGVLLNLQAFRTSKALRSPRLYFYVPKGLKKLAIYQPASLPEIMEIHFFDSQGRRVKPETFDARQMYLVDIPAGEDGKVWSLGNLVAPNQTIEMLNAPQVFSLYPDTLLVPEDAITK